MAGPGICVLCLADTCTSEVHPVFNPVAPYGYLLSDMYLFMYKMPLSMSLLGFGMGTMLANFHMCGIMLCHRLSLHW